MGTEQQQELKSEKRRTGSPIKTVLFTDHSIESRLIFLKDEDHILSFLS